MCVCVCVCAHACVRMRVCVRVCLFYTVEANGLACGEMHLQPQPLFAVSSDNVQHLAVAGTPSGRILLAGKDGCLYEVVYQVSAHCAWTPRLLHHQVPTGTVL